MAFSTKLKLNNNKATQQNGENLTFLGDNQFSGSTKFVSPIWLDNNTLSGDSTSRGFNLPTGRTTGVIATLDDIFDNAEILSGGSGIIKNGLQIDLGGSLSGNTILDGGSVHSFEINNLQAFRIEFESGSTITDNSVDGHGLVYGGDYSDNFIDNSLISKLYVDNKVSSGTTASTVYNLSSPSTVTVGGLNAGSTLVGKTSNEILEEILVPYLEPTFSSFSIQGQSTLIEANSSVSGSKTFTWNATQDSNVATNSIGILDFTDSNLLASGLANDDIESGINVGTVTLTGEQSNTWRISGESTQNDTFTRDFTVQSRYPYFYGTFASGGAAAGSNRPSILQITNQIETGGATKVIANTANDINNVDYNSSSDDYIWLAVPASATIKTSWFVTSLNQGTIGGAVSSGGNLFPDPTSATGSTNGDAGSPWSSVNYRFYISNYQTALSDPIDFLN